ncbi:MAG: 2-oxoacid:acceptor oxidoreductase family protein [Candidatus Aminicenantes bacterium]
MTKYLEVKWYGRTGQRLLTTASVLAEVLAMEGKYVQTVPDFYSDKNSAFFQVYNRLSDSPVRLHSAIAAADIIVIMDPALILNASTDLKANTKENAVYIVNTSAAPGLIQEKLTLRDNHIFTLDTNKIIREEIGNGNSLPNVPLITVLISWIDWISVEIFKQRLRQSLSYWLTADRIAANIKFVDSVAHEFKKSNNAELASISSNWES